MKDTSSDYAGIWLPSASVGFRLLPPVSRIPLIYPPGSKGGIRVPEIQKLKNDTRSGRN